MDYFRATEAATAGGSDGATPWADGVVVPAAEMRKVAAPLSPCTASLVPSAVRPQGIRGDRLQDLIVGEDVERHIIWCEEIRDCRDMEYMFWSLLTVVSGQVSSTGALGVAKKTRLPLRSKPITGPKDAKMSVMARVLQRLKSQEDTGASTTRTSPRLTDSARRRCFHSFYAKSNLEGDYAGIERIVVDNEHLLRNQIRAFQEEQWIALARLASETLGQILPRLVTDWNVLSVVENEAVGRRVLQGMYFDMLCEAAATFELLHRRHVMFVVEPHEREKLASLEAQSWVVHRKRQVAREEGTVGAQHRLEIVEVVEQKHRRDEERKELGYTQWDEMSARCELVRVEKVERLRLRNHFHEEHRDALYAQLRFEQARRTLSAEQGWALSADEAHNRTMMTCLERTERREVEAQEVAEFLLARRKDQARKWGGPTEDTMPA